MLLNINHFGHLPGVKEEKTDNLDSVFKKTLKVKQQMTSKSIAKGFSQYYELFVEEIFNLEYGEKPDYENL